ncbi:MAG TPA: hypothetical protein VMG08_00005 [Allosphingosinicella sp.]|nr:hypothetical protein [Allosphingosinicella sp.]
MEKLLVPGTYSYMLHQAPVDAAYLADFTAAKQRRWGRLTQSIDDFVYDQIVERIGRATGLRSAVLATVNGIPYRTRLKERVDGEFNRGLAVISMAKAPAEFEIHNDAPYKMMPRDHFEQALRGLYSDHCNTYGRDLRFKVAASVRWADACAFGLLEGAAKALARQRR